MKVFFDTLGCPKNYNDTQVAKGILEAEGYEISNVLNDSDVAIVNTCGFINDAKKESIEAIFTVIDNKKKTQKLVVSGCLSKRYADELFKEIPEVDLFIGVNEYDELPELLKNLDKRQVVIREQEEKKLPIRKRKLEKNQYSQTLKIAEGCNNRCAYCIIPKIRGQFRSKTIEDIVSEANILADNGCKELILIAQDVTNYGMDIYGKLMLPKLLKELVKISKIKWIRLMYCYEDKITDELIDVMAREPKICKYIDIPIQHASDTVLKSMRRHSTRQSITNTINRLRSKIPNIHIRTTLIVGFPGETEENFLELLDFVEETEFQRLGVFAYSLEEDTEAYNMKNQVLEETKIQRLNRVMEAQLLISNHLNRLKIGETLNILVEELDSEELNGIRNYIGRTEYDAPEIDNGVIFKSKNKLIPGDLVKVYINDAFDYDLVGEEVEENQ